MVLRKAVLAAVIPTLIALGSGASAFAAGEPHPYLNISFGHNASEAFSDPNGIAVEEATGDVYVADIGTNTVYKFDANGNPVDFTGGAGAGTNALTGADTPAKVFSFPNGPGTPAAIAVDNACLRHTPVLTGVACEQFDPSAGDLYVIDAGHGVIDKFNPEGKYLGQITERLEGERGLAGLAVDASGDLLVSVLGAVGFERVDVFDDTTVNNFIKFVFLLGKAEEGSADGFAAGPNGDYYMTFESCCTRKRGGGLDDELISVGDVDIHRGDVAVAVDPVTGHLYADYQSSITEWDTGGMNEFDPNPTVNGNPNAAFVSEFGSLELSGVSGQQGGIAVDGATGRIYVSDPVNGRVYEFASATSGVAVGTPVNVSRTGATLRGSVDPRGTTVTSCQFEYEQASLPATDHSESIPPVTSYFHSVPCAQLPGQIGSGTSSVSADIPGPNEPPLEPGALYYFRLVAGGASGASPSTGRFATVDAGPGIKGFSVSFLNQDGTPDTQAGSHPYEMVTSFTLNTKIVPRVPGADSAYQLLPAGTVKDVIVDTPPGFVGNPNASEAKCALGELEIKNEALFEEGTFCPPGSRVGTQDLETIAYGTGPHMLYNVVPPRGAAAQLGFHVIRPTVVINVSPVAGGQYPLQAESLNITAIEPLFRATTILPGVLGSGFNRKPFLTLPTACNGPLRSTIKADFYQDPGKYYEKESLTENMAGQPVGLTGCSKLAFPPEIKAAPDVKNASSASGLTVDVNVPQNSIFNPDGLGESSLRDTTVALPAGVAINPSGGGGLQACSESLAGFEAGHGVHGSGFEEFNPQFEPKVLTPLFSPEPIEALEKSGDFCPGGSKIGTVRVKTPLLPNPLEGAVYLATQNQNPFGSLIAMYMMFEDPISGSTIKLTGEVKLCESVGQVIDDVSCEAQGQVITTFLNTPDLPFENLELHFFGGERAPLATPSRCGTYTTKAIFTPWDGNAPITSESSFAIEHGPNGGPCPGEALPFKASFTGGATNIQAGAFTSLDGTFIRQDGEQQIARVHFTLPPGLSGLLRAVKLCDEADANAGTCGPESLIGETTVSAGVGSDPVSVTGGKVYLTEKYHGAPFGLSVVDPVKAGPFDLERDTANPAQNPACDCIVVRGRLEVNPVTAAVTITTNSEAEGYAIPHFIDGIPVQIKNVNFVTTRNEFQFNPTSCAKMAISGEVESSEGQSHHVEVPFQVTNCATFGFKPSFKVSTSAKTSRAKGASLHVKLTYPKAPFGSQANIASVKVDLPKQLPSRLTTLQKACTEKQFAANPAGCPAASRVGYAKAITPLLPVPLEGPAYFVSHGGAQFPELIIVLEGYGITIDLHGETFINEHTNITSSTFHTVPDQPVETFELNLPEGPYSALAAPGGLCNVKGGLHMPTAFVAQNGMVIKQTTKISVTGCGRAKKAKASRRGKHHGGKGG